MTDFVPLSALSPKRPPSFDEASSVRHKAWAAGFDPAYWYAVEHDAALAPGAVQEVVFQGTSIALFRGRDGKLGAVENRCAHRHVKLSTGQVKDCQLTCRYHGWTYDADGKLTDVMDVTFDKPFPNVRLRSYPVAAKYGLIFVFFGDPALAAERPLPTIPELEGDDPWLVVPVDFTMKCHPTAYVNNVMDSTHVAALHRKFQTRSLIYGKVTRCESDGDRVIVSHDIELDKGGLLRFIVNPLKTQTQDACYQYPYLAVGVGGIFKLWNFMLPIDANTTRIFMLPCTERLKIPLLGITPPDALVGAFSGLARQLLVRPLFDEDVWAAEAEQDGYNAYFDTASVDYHPAIRPSYQLTVRKWEEHLAREADQAQKVEQNARASR
jgi:phenylpropionate dioxygenase-like ring-hydroxylating dioxygenase large terminal subunit